MKNVNFPIGDFLISIKNAALANNSVLSCQKSKLIKSVALALKEAGYVSEVKEDGDVLNVRLAYQSKKPVLMGLKLVSKPGLRIYRSVDEVKAIKGPSIYILSTPKGVLLSKKAIKLGVGGEVIVEIW